MKIIRTVLALLSVATLVSCARSNDGNSSFSSDSLINSSESIDDNSSSVESSSKESSSSKEESSSTSSASSPSNSSSSSKNPSISSKTSSSSFSSSSQTPAPTVSEVSILEAVNKCKGLTMPNTQPHVVEGNERVIIKGHVIQNIDIGTTKSGYTPNGKTMLVDETGWILCSSLTNVNTSLYQKVKDYVDADTTQYEVKGHIALSFGVPEIVVEEFTWKSDLKINYNINSLATKIDNISSFYEDSYNIEYNCKGNGIGKIVTLENLTCVGRADGSSTGKWTFIDKDNKYLDVMYETNRNIFTPGKVYNLTGLQNVYHYNASFRCLRHSDGDQNFLAQVDTTKAVSTSVKDLFNNVSYKDDSYNKVSKTYFNNKSNIYKVDAYVNHYEASGKWYVTISDSDYAPTSANDAASHYQVAINNVGYWNVSEYTFSYENLYSYEDSGEPITLYFSLYQENHISIDPIKTKAVWKIYLYEDLVPEYIPEV